MYIVNILRSILFGDWSSMHEDIFARKDFYAQTVIFAQKYLKKSIIVMK